MNKNLVHEFDNWYKEWFVFFCAVRKLIFRFCYNLEKHLTCPDMVGILHITEVLMVYKVADHYLAYSL